MLSPPHPSGLTMRLRVPAAVVVPWAFAQYSPTLVRDGAMSRSRPSCSLMLRWWKCPEMRMFASASAGMALPMVCSFHQSHSVGTAPFLGLGVWPWVNAIVWPDTRIDTVISDAASLKPTLSIDSVAAMISATCSKTETSSLSFTVV